MEGGRCRSELPLGMGNEIFIIHPLLYRCIPSMHLKPSSPGLAGRIIERKRKDRLSCPFTNRVSIQDLGANMAEFLTCQSTLLMVSPGSRAKESSQLYGQAEGSSLECRARPLHSPVSFLQGALAAQDSCSRCYTHLSHTCQV